MITKLVKKIKKYISRPRTGMVYLSDSRHWFTNFTCEKGDGTYRFTVKSINEGKVNLYREGWLYGGIHDCWKPIVNIDGVDHILIDVKEVLEMIESGLIRRYKHFEVN